MADTKTNAEDFIYDPETIGLVIAGDVPTERQLKESPYVVPSKTLAGDYGVIYLKERDIDKVLENIEHYTNSIYPFILGLLGEAELDAAGIAQVQRQEFLKLRGSGVLLGFVDTGIDYTLDTFRYADGSSKIRYIWDQTIKGSPPKDFLFGSEYDNETISRALKSENPAAVVPHRDTVGHGTFIASVAGGRESGGHLGAAPDAEIIAVKLRKAQPYYLKRYLIPAEQENAFTSDDFMLGIQYILDKAQMLQRPVAICVSLGTNMGIHNGFSRIETFLAKVAGNKGVAVCVAAGNEAQAAHHVTGKITVTGQFREIELRASDTIGDIYLFIINTASDRMSVAVKSPAGERINRVPARSGTSYTHRLTLEPSTVTIEYIFPVEASGEQVSRIKILSATPGIWTVTVYGDTVLDGVYHAYLPLTGFIDPATQFLSPNPDYTTVTPANAYGTVTTGAYNSTDNSIFAASSRGPSLLPSVLPDLTAPGADVGGWYPGRQGKMSGTSVAAAITAGACALLLQWGVVEKSDPTLDSYHIRAMLIGGCVRDDATDYPNNSWGYGKLNLLNTFKALRPQ